MNGDLLQKGCIINDKKFAAALKQIAANIEDGNLGVSDAMEMIEKEQSSHTKTSMVLIKTLTEE